MCAAFLSHSHLHVAFFFLVSKLNFQVVTNGFKNKLRLLGFFFLQIVTDFVSRKILFWCKESVLVSRIGFNICFSRTENRTTKKDFKISKIQDLQFKKVQKSSSLAQEIQELQETCQKFSDRKDFINKLPKTSRNPRYELQISSKNSMDRIFSDEQ